MHYSQYMLRYHYTYLVKLNYSWSTYNIIVWILITKASFYNSGSFLLNRPSRLLFWWKHKSRTAKWSYRKKQGLLWQKKVRKACRTHWLSTSNVVEFMKIMFLSYTPHYQSCRWKGWLAEVSAVQNEELEVLVQYTFWRLSFQILLH